MGLFDFLSGSSQDPSQQGLPPQHSSVARLLELAGGLTGLTPLAAAGYLADQGTVTKFNEAYWPKFKNQMVQAGVPQQKVDMLDSMPIQQRTAYANQLYQAALTNVPKEPKYTAAMGPNGQEEFIDPLSGRVLSTLPKGAYTSSFKPKSEAEKFGSPTSLFEQDYLSKHPGDYAGAASYAANAYEQIRSKYAKPPRVDVSVNTPVPMGDLAQDPASKKWGFYGRNGEFHPVSSVPPAPLSNLPKPAGTGANIKFPAELLKSYTVQMSKTAPGAALLTPIPGSGGMFSWPKEPMVYYNGKYFKKGPSGNWDTPVQ